MSRQPSSIARTPESTTPISQVYAVRADMIALTIDAGQVIHGQQIAYRPEPHDDIKTAGKNEAPWVFRDGQPLGTLVGANHDRLYTLDRLVGDRLDNRWIQNPENYRVSAVTSAGTTQEIPLEAVFHKFKPTDMALVGIGEYEWPLRYTIYLDLPQSLIPGQRYQINLKNTRFAPVDFLYDPAVNPSEAIHISHLGFRPDDPVKVGFLSTWTGNGGGLSYTEGQTFWLVDEQLNQKVYSGKTVLSKAKAAVEDARGRNYNGTDVYWMDFSQFSQPGRYRLCVEGIGCSVSFEIQSDIWTKAFYVSARGFYHQRSGIALEKPYTSYYQPRSFHPDDGTRVYQSRVSLLETDGGLGDQDAFEALLNTRTDEVLTNAWGGYFDAGDWDRRIQHLEGTRLLLELVELFPDYFQTVNLNLPESDNALPDLLDEALWGLDCFRRLQAESGGIRGGIESAAIPRRGEASWQESLVVMAYAPDIWSSYVYAGVAAQAAYVLQQNSPALAETYQKSALRAMTYAEQELTKLDPQKQAALHHDVRDKRNLAALELYRLTRNRQWHQLFLDTTVFDDETAPAFQWASHNHRDAAFLYTRLTNLPINPTIQSHARQALLQDANTMAALGQNTGFKWTKSLPDSPIVTAGSFGNPKATQLLRAYHLTQDDKLLKAAILASQFSAGANPENMVYTTGLGHRSPEHPLVINQRITNQAPPPGITVFGPLDTHQFSDYWIFPLLKESVFPSLLTMPTAESYLDIFLYPAVTEFTIDATIAPTAYTWGYLAARARQ